IEYEIEQGNYNVTQLKSELTLFESEISYLNNTYHLNLSSVNTTIKNIENQLNTIQTKQNQQKNSLNSAQEGVEISYILGIIALIVAIVALITGIMIRKPPNKPESVITDNTQSAKE
ncbi:MAG: hypothetical protein ACP5T1_07300, partial [Thermoplasmata archaeon]